MFLFKAVFDAAYRKLEREKRNPFTLEQGRAIIAVLAQAKVDLGIGLVSALILKRLCSYQRPTKAEAKIVVAYADTTRNGPSTDADTSRMREFLRIRI